MKYARPNTSTVRLRRISFKGSQTLSLLLASVSSAVSSGSGSTAGKPTSSGLLRWKIKNNTATTATTTALEMNAACQVPINVYAHQPANGDATRPPNA
ncbi:hypothetical protein D3C81_1450270 [compost metagenome]